MSALSEKLSRSARDSLSVILKRLQSVGQNTYAGRIGKSESTISERKDNGYFERQILEIDALDCKVVPKTTRVCKETQIPVSISTVVKARMICAGALGENSEFIRMCDKELRSIGIIKRDQDGELTIPVRYLK